MSKSRINLNRVKRFILSFASKINFLYKSGCNDTEDYIQTGYLKLAELRQQGRLDTNSEQYIISSIGRAMRKEAVDSIGMVSASTKIKSIAHMAERLLYLGRNKKQVCLEFDITESELDRLLLILDTKFANIDFNEPIVFNPDTSTLDDILASCDTEEDRELIKLIIGDSVKEKSHLTRKQIWSKLKKIKPNLIRAGFNG